MRVSKVAVVLLALTCAPVSGWAQDLFDRLERDAGQEELVSIRSYRGRDRMDLRVGGTYPTGDIIRDRRYSRIGLDSVIDSDFACGRFDFRANLRNLLGKEAREDFLETMIGAVESELLYNALVLLMESAPTLANAYEHFRVNANAVMGVGYDRCQAIESAISDGLQSARAQAIKDCVERKRQQGVKDPNEALAACERENQVSGLLGDPTTEYDLGRELEKVFGLDQGTSRDLQRLLSKVRITPRGVAGEVRSDPVLEEFRMIEEGYIAAWTEAVDTTTQNPQTPLPRELEERLSPKGVGGTLPVEVKEIAAMPKAERTVWIRKLAMEAALVDLTMRVQELERKLAAVAKLPQNNAGRTRHIEQSMRDVRRQLAQIEELSQRVEKYNRVYLGLTGAGRKHEVNHAYRATVRARSEEFRKRKENVSRPVGELQRRRLSDKTLERLARGQRTGVVHGQGCEDCPPARSGSAPASGPNVVTPSVGFGTVNE